MLHEVGPKGKMGIIYNSQPMEDPGREVSERTFETASVLLEKNYGMEELEVRGPMTVSIAKGNVSQ